MLVNSEASRLALSAAEMDFVAENALIFTSPSQGTVTFDDISRQLAETVLRQTGDKYTIMVGTDSHVRNNHEICFVTVIFVHRVGKGGWFFYRRFRKNRITGLRQRMIYEATQSLTVASMLAVELGKRGCTVLDLEVHADIGAKGDSRTVVKEIVGMIEAQGFISRVKPDAPAATKVADRFTR